jgi:hypothetical protein
MDNVEINIAGTETFSDTQKKVQDSVGKTEQVIVRSMGTSEQAFDTAARESGKFGDALDKASGAGSQLSGGIGDIGGALTGFVDMQKDAANKASELARKQLDVDQAYEDTQQAAVDLKQATLDLTQSQIDSKQSAADAEQAQLDVKQSLLDAETAQTDYNDAVKEFGPGSAEAKQASQDLAQAQADLKQANIDSEQATADAAQATADGEQATRDLAQASIDAKSSQQGLNDAQKEMKPPSELESWGSKMEAIAPLIMGVVGVTDLLMLANSALSGSWVAQAAGMVGSKIAMVASTVATGAMTAAQWALNVALNANPIGLIILAIAALVAAVVWIATKTTWFQDLWNMVWGAIGTPVKALWEGIKSGANSAIEFAKNALNWILDFPNMMSRTFSNLANIIIAPFKTAWNWIANGWNNSVGRLSFTVPSWVPGIGGGGFSMPRLPTLARGGEIMREGAAYVHKGERVLPAGTNGLWGGGMGGGAIQVVVSFIGGSDELRKWVRKNTRFFGGGGDNAVQIAWGPS